MEDSTNKCKQSPCHKGIFMIPRPTLKHKVPECHARKNHAENNNGFFKDLSVQNGIIPIVVEQKTDDRVKIINPKVV